MKKHAIIPVFIPHRGCPNDCVFCNQKAITARQPDVTPDDVRDIIETYLPTLTGRGLETIEVAFFGGSFTGLPIEEQSAFLAVASEYKRKGLIDKIHMSTRPDYIDKEILDNLRRWDADTIELGVQSFDDAVLTAASIANGEDPLTTDPALSVTAEYEGRKTVVVPGNYTALSSYLRKDAASMLFLSMDREKALKLTVCDIATFYLAPQGGSDDVVLVELVTKDQTFYIRTDGGNQWKNILTCCMEGTYHDKNIPME